MRYEDLYVAGTGRRLPEPLTVEDAERAGLCDRRALWRTEIVSACVATEESAPEMAAHAARAALRQAGSEPDDITLILHASTYYQGHDLWPAASYIQREAVGNRCPAIEVAQMSNGGMAAIELAAGHLTADRGRHQALVTTGDRFRMPGYDRWHSDPGTVCGDGGTALVLSNGDGLARLLSLATVSDPSLEKMTRGKDPFGDAPFSVRPTVDLDVHRDALTSEIGLDEILDRIDAGQRETLRRALADAETALEEIDWFVLPTLGRGRLKAHFFDAFGIDPDRTTWSWGRRTGHLGAGDQIAGLGHLIDSGGLQPGHRCLLAGVGAGFTWSTAVVEMCHAPA